MLLIHLCHFET